MTNRVGDRDTVPDEVLDLVDIGANLTAPSFEHDRDEVIARAEAAGVRRMIVTGSSLEASRHARDLAESRPGTLFATAGVHPHEAKTCGEGTLDGLRELAASDAVVAIGECGLDYNRDFSPRPQQDRWFEAQLGLAAELGLPAFLHERDAHERFMDIIRGMGASMPRAVLHCFTGDEAELETSLEAGLFIGITGWICDERRGAHLKDLVGRIPTDRLMIETDAPYLVPRTMPKKPKRSRNEPAFLPWVLAAVAEATARTPDEIARTTTATACEFFSLTRAGTSA